MPAFNTERQASAKPPSEAADLRADLAAFLHRTDADLYSGYEDLRSRSPVHWDPVFSAWIVSRYEDVRTVFADKSFHLIATRDAVARVGKRMGRSYGSLARLHRGFKFIQLQEEHQESRQALGRLLTRASLDELTPAISALAASLAGSVAQRGTFDAVTDFAELLPTRVMTRILGLPDGDAALLWRGATDLSRAFEPATPALYARVDAQLGVALDHLAQRVKEDRARGTGRPCELHRTSPQFEGEEGSGEAAAAMFAAFWVGTETTAAAIGNSVHYLVQHPERYERAQDDPSFVEGIVDEVLRLESPAQRIGRVASEPRQIGGQSIKAGDILMLLLGSANRDPLQFDDPSSLDESRRTPVVTFGAGRHQCLGSNLARLVIRIALEWFLRLPRVVATGPATRYRGRAIRRLTSLPVTFAESSPRA